MNAPKRFSDKVRQSASCWEWTASLRKDGYGNFYLAGKIELAHRAAYYFATGQMPSPDQKVCHRCDNRRCVNPAHLFLGTQRDNVRDMFAKGRDNHARPAGTKNPRAKLTPEQVEIIRSGKFKSRELARQWGVAESTISMVKRGHNWSSENASRRAEMRLTA